MTHLSACPNGGCQVAAEAVSAGLSVPVVLPTKAPPTAGLTVLLLLQGGGSPDVAVTPLLSPLQSACPRRGTVYEKHSREGGPQALPWGVYVNASFRRSTSTSCSSSSSSSSISLLERHARGVACGHFHAPVWCETVQQHPVPTAATALPTAYLAVWK